MDILLILHYVITVGVLTLTYKNLTNLHEIITTVIHLKRPVRLIDKLLTVVSVIGLIGFLIVLYQENEADLRVLIDIWYLVLVTFVYTSISNAMPHIRRLYK